MPVIQTAHNHVQHNYSASKVLRTSCFPLPKGQTKVSANPGSLNRQDTKATERIADSTVRIPFCSNCQLSSRRGPPGEWL
jgi:hypothetical protein